MVFIVRLIGTKNSDFRFWRDENQRIIFIGTKIKIYHFIGTKNIFNLFIFYNDVFLLVKCLLIIFLMYFLTQSAVPLWPPRCI